MIRTGSRAAPRDQKTQAQPNKQVALGVRGHGADEQGNDGVRDAKQQ